MRSISFLVSTDRFSQMVIIFYKIKKLKRLTSGDRMRFKMEDNCKKQKNFSVPDNRPDL